MTDADHAEGPIEPLIKPPKVRARLPRPTIKRWGMNPEDRMRVMEACYVLPGRGWINHFVVMMLMSVTVAIMGLSANSPALVIGAMLIAPLMTPVLGVAASISMALTESLLRSLATVILATAGAIALGWLVAGILPGELLTSEVLARTAPDARDLVVALAAGLAGSYATARPDVSSSLPGVAIAVALVPPLAVVGITARAGENDLALGALLLYGTNLAAIITVSTVVFIVTGFVPGGRLRDMAPRVLAGGLLGLAVIVVLGVVLFGRTGQSVRDAENSREIREATSVWLDNTYDVFDIEIDGTEIAIEVIGPDEPPSTSLLAAEFEEILGTTPDLRVSWIQGQTAQALEAVERQQQLNRSAIDRQIEVSTAIDAWLESDGDDLNYSLTRRVIDEDGISIEVTSTTPPPPRESLVARLAEVLGGEPNVVIEWQDLSVQLAEQGAATLAEIEADVSRVARDWATAEGVEVQSLSYDGETVRIGVVGETAPDGGPLLPAVTDVVGDQAEILVTFSERALVIPIPTATPIPTPTVTPTAVPTSTPVPTPTVEPTPEVTPTPEP